MPPVIVLSYSNSESDIRRAHALGAEFYLIKSVALEGTVGLVKSVENFWKHHFLPRRARANESVSLAGKT